MNLANRFHEKVKSKNGQPQQLNESEEEIQSKHRLNELIDNLHILDIEIPEFDPSFDESHPLDTEIDDFFVSRRQQQTGKLLEKASHIISLLYKSKRNDIFTELNDNNLATYLFEAFICQPNFNLKSNDTMMQRRLLLYDLFSKQKEKATLFEQLFSFICQLNEEHTTYFFSEVLLYLLYAVKQLRLLPFSFLNNNNNSFLNHCWCFQRDFMKNNSKISQSFLSDAKEIYFEFLSILIQDENCFTNLIINFVSLKELLVYSYILLDQNSKTFFGQIQNATIKCLNNGCVDISCISSLYIIIIQKYANHDSKFTPDFVTQIIDFICELITIKSDQIFSFENYFILILKSLDQILQNQPITDQILKNIFVFLSRFRKCFSFNNEEDPFPLLCKILGKIEKECQFNEARLDFHKLLSNQQEISNHEQLFYCECPKFIPLYLATFSKYSKFDEILIFFFRMCEKSFNNCAACHDGHLDGFLIHFICHETKFKFQNAELEFILEPNCLTSLEQNYLVPLLSMILNVKTSYKICELLFTALIEHKINVDTANQLIPNEMFFSPILDLFANQNILSTEIKDGNFNISFDLTIDQLIKSHYTILHINTNESNKYYELCVDNNQSPELYWKVFDNDSNTKTFLKTISNNQPIRFKFALADGSIQVYVEQKPKVSGTLQGKFNNFSIGCSSQSNNVDNYNVARLSSLQYNPQYSKGITLDNTQAVERFIQSSLNQQFPQLIRCINEKDISNVLINHISDLIQFFSKNPPVDSDIQLSHFFFELILKLCTNSQKAQKCFLESQSISAIRERYQNASAEFNDQFIDLLSQNLLNQFIIAKSLTNITFKSSILDISLYLNATVDFIDKMANQFWIQFPLDTLLAVVQLLFYYENDSALPIKQLYSFRNRTELEINGIKDVFWKMLEKILTKSIEKDDEEQKKLLKSFFHTSEEVSSRLINIIKKNNNGLITYLSDDMVSYFLRKIQETDNNDTILQSIDDIYTISPKSDIHFYSEKISDLVAKKSTTSFDFIFETLCSKVDNNPTLYSLICSLALILDDNNIKRQNKAIEILSKLKLTDNAIDNNLYWAIRPINLALNQDQKTCRQISSFFFEQIRNHNQSNGIEEFAWRIYYLIEFVAYPDISSGYCLQNAILEELWMNIQGAACDIFRAMLILMNHDLPQTSNRINHFDDVNREKLFKSPLYPDVSIEPLKQSNDHPHIQDCWTCHSACNSMVRSQSLPFIYNSHFAACEFKQLDQIVKTASNQTYQWHPGFKVAHSIWVNYNLYKKIWETPNSLPKEFINSIQSQFGDDKSKEITDYQFLQSVLKNINLQQFAHPQERISAIVQEQLQRHPNVDMNPTIDNFKSNLWHNMEEFSKKVII